MPNNYGGGVPAGQIIREPRKRRKPRNITAMRPRRRNVRQGRRIIPDPPTGRRPRTHDGVPRDRRSQDPYAQILKALERLEFGPQERALDTRRQQEQQFGVNQNAWYSQHVRDVQASQAQQAAFNTGLVQGAYNQANQAAATDTGANNQLLQQAQASAAQRGATVDPTVFQQANQAAGARQASMTSGANLLAQQASNQGAFLANNVRAAGEQGIQAQQDTQARQRKIEELAAALSADKGATRVKNRLDLQEREHKQRLENAAFGLEQAEFAADIADDRADNRRLSRQQRAINRDRRIDNRRQAAAERRQQRNTESLIRDRREDNARQERKDRRTLRERGLSRNDRDGDGIADRGKYRGYAENERDRFDQSVRLLRRKGVTAKNAQEALDALINEESVPPRIAKRALRYWLRKRRQHAGSLTPRNPDGTPG